MSRTADELFEVPPPWRVPEVVTSDGRVSKGEPVVRGRSKTVGTVSKNSPTTAGTSEQYQYTVSGIIETASLGYVRRTGDAR